MDIREIVQGLTDDQRTLLMLAFNSGTEATVEYEKGKYVAVNQVNPPSYLRAEQVMGHWSTGTVGGTGAG